MSSDGSTPEEVTAQILAIAPILPGQKSFTKPSQPRAPPQQQQALAPQPAAAQGDLVDFGSDGAGAPFTPVTQPYAAQQPVQSSNNAMLSELNDSAPVSSGKPSTLQRTDTETSEVDNFVDASG